jgi:hypothetical protein
MIEPHLLLLLIILLVTTKIICDQHHFIVERVMTKENISEYFHDPANAVFKVAINATFCIAGPSFSYFELIRIGK